MRELLILERFTHLQEIVMIYSPSGDCNVFVESIQNILSTINQSKIYDLMCGDFNVHLLNKDC